MNKLAAMTRTVDAVLDQVYGGKENAAAALGVVKTAPYNWLSWGHFPLRVALKISREAKEKGIDLPLEEIPVLDNKPGDAA